MSRVFGLLALLSFLGVASSSPADLAYDGVSDVVGASRQMCHGVHANMQTYRDEADGVLETNRQSDKSDKKDPISPEAMLEKIRVWPMAKMLEPFPILCVMYTHSMNADQAMSMREAWGHKCDRQVFMTNDTATLRAKGIAAEDLFVVDVQGGEAWTNMWQKTRSTMMLLASLEWVNDYDFIFFGGDDAFLIVENLRKLMSEPEVMTLHEAGTSLVFGYRFVQKVYSPDHKRLIIDGPEFVSGAGYVINIVALKFLGALVKDHPECRPNDRTSQEDLYLSVCLAKVLGVPVRDARDAHGEDRFAVMTPWHMAMEANRPGFTPWWPDYRESQPPGGLDVMSQDAILFHYVRPVWFVKQITNQIYRKKKK